VIKGQTKGILFVGKRLKKLCAQPATADRTEQKCQ